MLLFCVALTQWPLQRLAYTDYQANARIHLCLLLFTLVLTESRNDKDKRLLLDNSEAISSQLQALRVEVQSLRSQVVDQATEIRSLKQSSQGGGPSYIIWGKKSCPALNGTQTVYSGMSSGRTYVDTGSGINTLCLPHNPDPSPPDFPRSFQYNDVASAGSIHGSEYQFNYRHVAIDDDVPCAACVVTNARSTLMIPAKTSCPVGWTVQYQGVLTSGKQGHQATDYLCLDQNPEYLTEGARMHNYDGKLFYPVHAICGSLPCPPYKGQQLLSCVVCSM